MERTWYAIELDPERKYRGQLQDFTDAYKKEVEDWIIDLFENSDKIFVWKHFKCCTYEFSTEEAAMAFKLRWI